jgi:hypothetical protein
MNRRDFIAYTVSSTLPEYLRRYCAPYTVSQAQAKCLADATALADQIYGAEVTLEVVSPPQMTPPSRQLPTVRRRLPPKAPSERPNNQSASADDSDEQPFDKTPLGDWIMNLKSR